MRSPLEVYEGIRDGWIDTIFRLGTRPGPEVGGTLRTAVGQIRIEAIETIELDRLTEDHARRAGFDDLAELRVWLGQQGEGRVTVLRVCFDGPNPPIASA